jgi:hypothetical protein
MWDLTNRTPFAAERTFARDRDGSEVLLVVVKATFRLDGDALLIADEQQPVERTPRYLTDERSSLIYDGDFALVKQATDVLMVGHAHALGEKPSTASEVSVRVGEWSKRALVFGDRRWTRELSGWWLSDPEPFTRMPLVYERAFGGEDEEQVYEANPVGVGFAEAPKDGLVAPNFEDPDDLLRSPGARPRPMGFGPIARHWPLRRRLAGSYDERWLRERRPLVPDDFDDAFHQAAPPDQRVALEGGEEVELVGVSARGVLRFELPRLSLSFRSRLAGELVEHPSSLHTLLLLPDDERVVMAVASALPCHQQLYALEGTLVEGGVEGST